ncbi:hypothetical protein SISNIDRAFT_458811, partial [Sistotremastrum niveocremeum HHB9708]
MMQDWLLSSRLRTSDGSIAREYIIARFLCGPCFSVSPPLEPRGLDPPPPISLFHGSENRIAALTFVDFTIEDCPKGECS